jgi:hypothetical protein
MRAHQSGLGLESHSLFNPGCWVVVLLNTWWKPVGLGLLRCLHPSGLSSRELLGMWKPFGGGTAALQLACSGCCHSGLEWLVDPSHSLGKHDPVSHLCFFTCSSIPSSQDIVHKCWVNRDRNSSSLLCHVLIITWEVRTRELKCQGRKLTLHSTQTWGKANLSGWSYIPSSTTLSSHENMLSEAYVGHQRSSYIVPFVWHV